MKLLRHIQILIIIAVFSSGYVYAQDFGWYFKKGYDAHAQGKLAEAEKYYQQALELNGNNAALYNEIGKLYEAKGAKLSEIVWYYRGAIEIDPDFVDAYENLGRVYQQNQMLDQAIKNFEKALSLSPDRLSAQYSLGWIYLMGKDQPHKAAHYFDAVLKQKEIPMAYFGLGLSYTKIGDTPQVLDVVTTLNSKGETDLARKLEAAIRTPYTEEFIQRQELQQAQQMQQLQQDRQERWQYQPPGTRIVAGSTPPMPEASTEEGGVRLDGSPGQMRIRLRGSLMGPSSSSDSEGREYRKFGENP